MNRFMVSLLAASLMTAVPSVRADHENWTKNLQAQKSANDLIGKKVINSQNEDLGKVQDLIVNVEMGTAPFAVIATGGVLGAGRSKIAVPLVSLQTTADGKHLILDATKDQLQTASKSPTGDWARVADAEWAHRVDAFYGRPFSRDRAEREVTRDTNDPKNRDASDSRIYVRERQPKGGELLMSSQDAALCDRVCEAMATPSVRAQNGVVHLYGTVDNDEARKSLEAKVRAVPGVSSVESHLKVRNP